MVTDSTGATVGEDRFYPFGETRFTTGTIYTDKLFTGQREVTGLGIYFFNARFYSPKLGRFLSADTIVPGAGNPQNLNRFSYVNNNPLRYNDPTGHMMTQYTDGGGGSYTYKPPVVVVTFTSKVVVTATPTAVPTSTPTRTHTDTATSTATSTASMTATITPPCSNPSNLCATIVSGQATSVAFQTSTATSTPVPYGTITPFANNAVQTLVVAPVDHCLERPDLSGAPSCGQMIDLGSQLLGQYVFGMPIQDIPQPGNTFEVVNGGGHLLSDIIEASNNEPPMTRQQAQAGLTFTLTAFFTTILPWVLAL